MSWWLWALLLAGLALGLWCVTSPQFFTYLNVRAAMREIERKRKDHRYEEIKDAEGNHLGFRARSAPRDGGTNG